MSINIKKKKKLIYKFSLKNFSPKLLRKKLGKKVIIMYEVSDKQVSSRIYFNNTDRALLLMKI